MPGPLTHYLFGLDTTKHIKSLPIYKIIKQYKSLFIIGLQGPDPIKYYADKKSKLSHVGFLMHTERTRDFILSALTYTKNLDPATNEAMECLSYMSGFICHYVLDYMLHPYIYYLGGIEPFQHKKMESIIDHNLLKEKFDLNPDQFKIHKHVLKDVIINPSVLGLYTETLFVNYNIADGGLLFKTSYKAMRNQYNFHFHTLPFKLLSAFKSFQSEEENYLNKQKKVWLHPVTGNVYTFSVYQIFHNAMKVCYTLLQGAHQYVTSKLSYDDFKAMLPNVSYLTGMPLENDKEMKYFKP